MKKVKWGIAMLWQMFMGFISPLWLGWMFMDITGHGKGYGYDLGSERNIWVLWGVMELVIWLIAVIPIRLFALFFCFNFTCRINKKAIY